MSIASLDKNTDKIISRMTPEELARYVNGRFLNWAQVAQETEITKEEIDREADIFVKKHVNTLSGAAHFEYMKALHRESENTLVRAIGELQIKLFQRSITIEEWKINSLLYAAYAMDEILPPDEADKQHQEFKKTISSRLLEIQDIENGLEEFIHHNLWTTHGGAPEIPERDSVLIEPLLNSIIM